MRTDSSVLPEIPFPFEDFESQKYLQIDEEGYFLSKGVRFTDPEISAAMLGNLKKDKKNRFFTETSGQWVLVEAFDEPFVAEMVEVSPEGKWILVLPYGVQKSFDLEDLSLDEWDRFHGHTHEGVSFVLSRKAQNQFFNLLDSFTDDSISFQGQDFKISDWLTDNAERDREEFWSEIYKTEEQPAFDLGEPAKGLESSLTQIKQSRMRVAVLGAGKGHDAAHLAEKGHLVTAFDVSPLAIEEAKSRYGHLKNLSFQCGDVFDVANEHEGEFDQIFEHTLYCAVTPSRRNELVQVWRKMLSPQGTVLGVFFAMDKRTGPPYGGTEWELRKRFQDHFQFLYWTRWKHSLPRRLGKEVVIYMQKK